MPDFIWTEEKIRWYQAAVAWFGYDRVLADTAEPYLPRAETVCDLGCGTGYLAMELARRGYRVTAVDKSDATMDYLEQEAARRGLAELTLRRSGWEDLPPGSVWDNVVMALAGQPAEEMDLLRRFARKRLILFTKADRRSHIRPDGVAILRHASREEIEAALTGVPFETFPLSTPFGQPLRSLEDAAAYLRAYGEEDATPETAAPRLTATGDADYPFVLPGQKALNVFIIPGAEAAI